MVARLPLEGPGRELGLGLLGCLRQALEEDRADECTAQRAGGPFPRDRWAGMEEGASLQPERVPGGNDVDEHRLGSGHAGQGLGIGCDAALVGHDRRQGLAGVLADRLPGHLTHRHGLGPQLVGEQGHS